jgi:hypothetical protein
MGPSRVNKRCGLGVTLSAHCCRKSSTALLRGDWRPPAGPLIMRRMSNDVENRRRSRRLYFAALSALVLIAVSACDYVDANQTPVKTEQELRREKTGSLTGPGGLFGLGSEPKPEGPTLGVNAFLWRATLDTVSIWPIASADPYGGVVLTDWYAPPTTPSERFKLNVYILDRALRADGVRVSVFRQVRTTGGEWQEASVQPETAARLEEAILMRARQMRNQAAKGE